MHNCLDPQSMTRRQRPTWAAEKNVMLLLSEVQYRREIVAGIVIHESR